MFMSLSPQSDQELARISKVVNASFSPKVMAVDDARDNNRAAFSENKTQKAAVSKFWDTTDFACYSDKTGVGSWATRNC